MSGARGRMSASCGTEAFPYWKCSSGHSCDSLTMRCHFCGEPRLCEYYSAETDAHCPKSAEITIALGYFCLEHKPVGQKPWGVK